MSRTVYTDGWAERVYMFDVVSIGDRIKLARERADVSQRAVADHLGMTTQTVFRYEKGETRPKDEALRQIADFLGVSFTWLVAGIEEHSIQDHPSVYRAWLDSPTGKAATQAEREWIRSYRSDRKPTVESLSVMLAARRMELPADTEGSQ